MGACGCQCCILDNRQWFLGWVFVVWVVGGVSDSSEKVLSLSSFHTTTALMSRIKAKIFFHALPVKCVILWRLRRRYKADDFTWACVGTLYFYCNHPLWKEKNNVPVKNSSDFGKKIPFKNVIFCKSRDGWDLLWQMTPYQSLADDKPWPGTLQKL